MKLLKKAGLLSVSLLASALALSACGDAGSSTDAGSNVSQDVKKDVSISGSATFDKIKKDGKIVIGVKDDQPGLGYKDPTTNQYSGFDIQIAEWMAASLGVDKSNIEFKPVASSNRETALANGQVDLYVGTYSITDKRKALVGFAGPYFVTGQGLLVAKSNDTIKSKDDLKGKTVCSATGSTPIQNIKQNFPDTKTKEFDVYSKCVDELKNGGVDAVTTDEAILLGYASQDPDNLKVVGTPFTTENYGIGLKKGDTALKDYLNKILTDGHSTWQKIYDATLGKAGSETKATQPAVKP